MATVASIVPFIPRPGGSVSDIRSPFPERRVRLSGRGSSDDMVEPASEDGMNGTTQPDPCCIAFGHYQVYPRQRLVLEGDRPLHLGSRALDILIALLERPGELVSKQELTARVWPGIIVAEGNLKVHVAALRKSLCDGQAGNRYICTVPGRGYCFVAQVLRPDDPVHNAASERVHGLRTRPTSSARSLPLIGIFAAQLSHQQFIVIPGTEDMAKRIALDAAFTADDHHQVRFADLAAIEDPLVVPVAVAEAMGLQGGASDPLANIINFLEDRRILLILDNCRHMIGPLAEFAVSVLGCAPDAQILAISR